MAGPVPAIHVFLPFAPVQNQISVSYRSLPVWIHCVDEPHFPGSRPMFDRLLALNCVTNIVEVLVADEHFEPISFGETRNNAFAMFIGALG
jgi:hypothetical protein